MKKKSAWDNSYFNINLILKSIYLLLYAAIPPGKESHWALTRNLLRSERLPRAVWV